MPTPHSSRPRPSTFVSLYSGAGGLDLGFAKAGFTPVFANDIDSNAVATYNRIRHVEDPEWRDAARRFEGHTAIAGDVREVAADLQEGAAELVIGGPPCQGFSVAGRMNPDDPRSRHVFDFLGLVSRISPRAFVMENVAALARNKRWSDILQRLRSLGERNYKVSLHVLNASHWGVPQARERMFLVGLPQDGPDLTFPAPPTLDSPPTVRDALEHLPAAGMPGNASLCTAAITLAKSPVLRRSPYAGMLLNGQGRVISAARPAPTLPASMGGNRTPVIDEGELYRGDPAWIEQYHRSLFEEGKAPLRELPSDTKLRRLTVEEAAALQTFPRDLAWDGPQSARFRQIGNAVPPRLAFHVAAAVRAALGNEPESAAQVSRAEEELVSVRQSHAGLVLAR